MTNNLHGKVALVTGASSGIGKATAEALASEGASVVIVGRRADRLTQVASAIEASGGKVFPIIADITDETQVQQMVRKTRERYDRVDILVNNAGIMLLGPVIGADTEDWRRMINLNLLGLMYTTHAVLPLMLEQGQGHIVNLSSTAGRFANPNVAVYAATKFGVGAFSEALRKEVYQQNIRVTIIEPGATLTELAEHITDPATKERQKAWLASMRQMEPEDVAAAILYVVTQPAHVSVNELLVRPLDQEK